MNTPVIYWFRQDLRLTDLPGLAAAARAGCVIPVFILDETAGDEWSLGGASRWWLHHSLDQLDDTLRQLGGQLVLRRGDCADVLGELIAETGAQAVYASRQYQPWANAQEQAVREVATESGADFQCHPGTLLFEPEAIRTGGGTPFKVFTPFWRACLRQPEPQPPLPVPDLTFPSSWPDSDALASWCLCPEQPNWAAGWDHLWQPGENGARHALNDFLDTRVAGYSDGRDVPGETHTSRLSPFLKFGELSPRQIWWAAQNTKQQAPEHSAAVDKFLSELGWREFCNHLIQAFPGMAERAFNPKFEHFPWRNAPILLRAWQRGRTGYPIVDAGMRELWQTGFMHNRVRMITASFLTKHLLIHWRLGEQWFWDCLLDADLASNACSWQWVAGSGADAAPYFRIFNPIAQGEKFDADGDYVRRWVPELEALPKRHLHKPWEAPPGVLAAAGVVLDDNYPAPIVDHREARETALAAYATLKELSAH